MIVKALLTRIVAVPEWLEREHLKSNVKVALSLKIANAIVEALSYKTPQRIIFV